MTDTNQKNSVKYFLFSVVCIAGLIAYLYYSIKPFDKEAALQEYIAQETPNNIITTDINANQRTALKQLAVVNQNEIEIWKLIADEKNSIINYQIDILDIDNKIKKSTPINQVNTEVSMIDFYLLDNFVVLILKKKNFSIINKKSKLIAYNNGILSKKFTDISNIATAEKSYLYPSIALSNEEYKQFLFFPSENILLTPDQFQQQKQDAKNNSSWSFNKQYFVYQQNLYLITQKQLPKIFVKPISTEDMHILLEDEKNWLWNSLQVVDIKKINALNGISKQTTYLYSDLSNILLFENNYLYLYNTNGKLLWKITDNSFDKFSVEESYNNLNISTTNQQLIIQTNNNLILIINKIDGKIIKQIAL
ncbi:MAG: hypothetical protein H6553_09965 [Chitinophagales bacterium]|nr:hypothetical protein [Chitinophagales bacterium]